MCSNLCRLCGVEKSVGLNLFALDAIRTGILSKIIAQLPKEVIQIDASDNLTKFICSDCEITVNHFSEFCEMVKKTQKSLMVKSNNVSSTLNDSTAEQMLDCHTSGSKPVTVSVGADKKIRCEICHHYLEEVQLMTLHMVTHGLGTVVCCCRECGHRDEVGSFIKEDAVLCPNCFFTACSEKPRVPEANKKRHICEICKKSFSTLGHMNRHKMIHDGLKPFLCETCGTGFNQKASLKMHLLSHTGTFPHRCEWCCQSFRHKVSLQSHIINVHPQLAKLLHYECDHCKKQFATAHKLRRHYRSHTGEQPYRCLVCNKLFSQTGNLKNHMKKHKSDFSDIQNTDNLLETPAQKILDTMFDHHEERKDYMAISNQGHINYSNAQNALCKDSSQDVFQNFSSHECDMFSTMA